jgi:hypothetical protein
MELLARRLETPDYTLHNMHYASRVDDIYIYIYIYRPCAPNLHYTLTIPDTEIRALSLARWRATMPPLLIPIRISLERGP